MATPEPEPTREIAPPDARSAEPHIQRTVGLVAGSTILALIVGTLLGWVVFGQSSPGDTSVEAGFARDMSEHHAQAVEMSLEVLKTTDNEGVVGLATDIASTQGNQLGQMEGWIRQWELPMARPGDRMDWMDEAAHASHDMHQVEGAPMAGMASPEQMESLRAADREAADVLYLQLMTTHHLAGVEMAQAALDQGVGGEVHRLAQAMVNGQESEISLMHDMLADLGAESQEAMGMTVGVADPTAGDTHTEGEGTEGEGTDDAEETTAHDGN